MKKGKIGITLVLLVMSFLVKGQLVSIEAIAGKPITCEGDEVQLNVLHTSLGDPTLIFDWQPANLLNKVSIATPIAKPEVTTMFYVKVTDVDNNITLTDSVLVTVLPYPMISAGSNDTICINQTYKVTDAFLNNTIAFEWQHTGLGTLTKTNTLTPTYIPAVDELGIVHLILKSGGILFCKNVSDTLSLEILPLPESEIVTRFDTIYSDDSYTLLDAQIKNLSYESFSWSHSGSGALLNTHGLNPKYMPVAEMTENVDIILNVVGFAKCKIAKDTLKLKVYGEPIVDTGVDGPGPIDPDDPDGGALYGGADTILCDNVNFNFSEVTLKNIETFAWTHDGSGVLFNGDKKNPTYIPGKNEEGIVTFILKGQGYFEGRTVIDTARIKVLKSPVFDTLEDTLLCSNASMILSVSSGYNYLWNTGDTTSSIVVNPQENSVYGVTIKTDEGCWKKEEVKIDVSKFSFEVSENQTICQGDRLFLSATKSPEFTYLWSNGETKNEIVVTPKVTTTYDVTVSNRDNCFEKVSIVAKVNPLPALVSFESTNQDKTIIIAPENLVNYKFVHKNVVLQEGPSNYYFYGDELPKWDTIYVTGTNANGCSKETKVYASPITDIGITDGPDGNLLGDTILCDKSEFQFNKVTIENVRSFTWSHNGTGTLLNGSTPFPTYRAGNNEEGIVTFVLSAVAYNGLSFVADSAFIKVVKTPVFTLTPDTVVCSNKSIVLSVSPGFDYLWSTGQAGSSIEVNPQEDTTYEVTVSKDGCSAKEQIEVDVSELFFEVSDDKELCKGERLFLSVTNSPELMYSWSTGQSTNEIVVSPDVNTDYEVTVRNRDNCVETVTISTIVHELPVVELNHSETAHETIEVLPDNFENYVFWGNDKILQDGFMNTYYYGDIVLPWDSVFVIVTDENGCKNNNLDNLLDKDYFIIPNIDEVNAFSPNGDGINDKFLPNIRIIVMDRGGRIIHEGNDGWNGRLHGTGIEMPQATYFYISWNYKGEVFQRGAVTLVRD